MSRPHNCRHCSHMTCGDANWCSQHNELLSDGQIVAARKCPDWEWNPIDALTFIEWSSNPDKKAVLDGQMKLGGE